MAGWLGGEWSELCAALEAAPSWRGVRLHRVALHAAHATAPAGPLSIDCPPSPAPPDLAAYLSAADRVPWCDDGWYLPADHGLGGHVYHDAGAYYLQEPSAMAAAAALAPQPGERVLDLCAAPGGKATAIARRLGTSGTLVANDVDAGRAAILSRNLERTGCVAAVANERPERLADAWPQAFDAVLVDAPCSGEGMWRRGTKVPWSRAMVAGCAARQSAILASAVRLCRPGGRILYCTCTFNHLENEGVVDEALRRWGLEPEDLPPLPGWSPGLPQPGMDPGLVRARRLWPHRARGEGHFLALLRVPQRRAVQPAARRNAAWRPEPALADCLQNLLVDEPPHDWLGRAFVPAGDLPLEGLHVMRDGLPLALRRGEAWVPHHALAMALRPGGAREERPLSPEEAAAYVSGAPLRDEGARGWRRLHVSGLPLGWAHAAAGRANNAYPKGLRRVVSVEALG